MNYVFIGVINFCFMEIILWIIGIGLGVVLLKFLYCFILQLIGPGLVFGFMSLIICGFLALFDVMEWETRFLVAKWAFYIGSGIGVVMFLCHPIDTFTRAFDVFDDNTSSSSNSSSSSCSVPTRTTYGQYGHLYRTGNGKPNSIGLDDGSEIYVYDELGDGRIQDQYGDLWDVSGNTVRRV